MIVTAGVFDMSSWAVLLSRIQAAERELVCLLWGFGSQPAPAVSLDCGSTEQSERAHLLEILAWVLSIWAAALDGPKREDFFACELIYYTEEIIRYQQSVQSHNASAEKHSTEDICLSHFSVTIQFWHFAAPNAIAIKKKSNERIETYCPKTWWDCLVLQI